MNSFIARALAQHGWEPLLPVSVRKLPGGVVSAGVSTQALIEYDAWFEESLELMPISPADDDRPNAFDLQAEALEMMLARRHDSRPHHTPIGRMAMERAGTDECCVCHHARQPHQSCPNCGYNCDEASFHYALVDLDNEIKSRVSAVSTTEPEYQPVVRSFRW